MLINFLMEFPNENAVKCSLIEMYNAKHLAIVIGSSLEKDPNKNLYDNVIKHSIWNLMLDGSCTRLIN